MSTAASVIALRLGHVGLNVTDLARSRDFYTRVLDLEPMGESRDTEREWVFLGQDGSLVLTLWRQAVGSYDPTLPGLHHLALQVEDVPALESLLARLADLGVERRFGGGAVLHADGCDSGGVYFSDPDGIRLEVYVTSGLASTGAPVPGEGPACGHF